MLWTCRIELEPMGKQRPRIAKRGAYARAYTPPKTAQWEKDAATIMRAFWRRPPQTGAVRVVVRAYRARTQYMQAKKRRELTICTSKPDVDNVAKIVLDAMVKARVLDDDNQVVQLECSKRWAPYGEPGRVEVDLFAVVE